MNNLAISDSLAPIRNRFLEVLLRHQSDIQGNLELALEQSDQAIAALGRIEAILHKIAGTAGTLGFVALGEGARSAENAIIASRKERATPQTAIYLQIIDVLEVMMEITGKDA